MKNYLIVASKDVVATFTMDYHMFKMKFKMSSCMVQWIVQEHPELKGVPYNAEFPNDTIVVKFYSVGNLVIEEK